MEAIHRLSGGCREGYVRPLEELLTDRVEAELVTISRPERDTAMGVQAALEAQFMQRRSVERVGCPAVLDPDGDVIDLPFHGRRLAGGPFLRTLLPGCRHIALGPAAAFAHAGVDSEA